MARTATPEKRASIRKRLHYPVWAETKEGLVKAMIGDVSQTGALLTLPFPVEIADTFKIWLSATGDGVRRCTIMRRQDLLLGVQFTPGVTVSDAPRLPPSERSTALLE